MMIANKEKTDYFKILGVLLSVLGSSSVFANQLDDQSLSEQYGSVAKLTPIVIQAVKKDVQQPVDSQNELHQKIAQKMTDEAQRSEIYSTVLTDYEWEKKNPRSNKPGDKYLKPFDKYRIIDVGYNPYQKHDVRIATADRIYFWPGHEIDGTDIKH